MFEEKGKVVLYVFLTTLLIGGVAILYNVFQDVKSWGDDAEEDQNDVAQVEKTEEKEVVKDTVKDAVDEKDVETPTSTIEIVEKEVIKEVVVEKIVYVEKKQEEKPVKKDLKPVVKAELATCPADMKFQCWDLLSCYDYGNGYGSPALWTANTLEDVAPACGQWATDSAQLPTSWSCCCGYSEDWQEGGNKTCYSSAYTSNLTFE